MFGLGSQELLVILVIVLILFGANRLPQLARFAFDWIGAGLALFVLKPLRIRWVSAQLGAARPLAAGRR